MTWLDMSGFEKLNISSQVCKNKTEQPFSIIGRTKGGFFFRKFDEFFKSPYLQKENTPNLYPDLGI